MGEKRKSDYAGDRYGDWVVTGRASAMSGKRCWFVRNETTGEEKTMLQTELFTLGEQTVPVTIGTAESIGPLGDMVREANNPFAVGPGECKHAVPLASCPECGVTYKPQGKEALSAKIAQSVIQGSLLLEAMASVAMSKDPDCQTYAVESDWSAELPVDDSLAYIEKAELSGGIGEAAEETVSEAELDERVPAPDPMRAVIRQLLGVAADLRSGIGVLEAQSLQIIELLDEALKLSITG